jgi:hypothetical protein
MWRGMTVRRANEMNGRGIRGNGGKEINTMNS